MSGWTTAADLRAQMRRRWDRGDLLAEMVAPAAMFPMRLLLRVPASGDWSARFDEVRAWAAELQQGARTGYRLEERDVQHRVVGRNRLPHEAWVDTLDDALRLVAKTSEARVFRALIENTRERQPALLPWLARQPLRALALADEWPRLLDMVAWLQSHPRPDVYLRQVDLPGIHSKFIEAQRGVLAELLDLVLPADAIDAAFSGTTRFARRYGFRDKPLRVRLRFLDPAHLAWIPGSDADVTISQAAFERLAPRVSRVFVTENEINFLAFPPQEDALVIFGAGYGVDGFAGAAWLRECALHYWGDIDTHGFAILDQWRAHFTQARSLLMDHDTLLTHREQWAEELRPTQRDLPRLTADERRLYDDLRWRRLRAEPVRLEQERIGFGRVLQAVAGTQRCRQRTEGMP
jgi:hypothetical protein